jgi:hypothetical protein
MIATRAEPGAYLGRATLRSAELDTTFDLPLLRIGDGSDVIVNTTERDGQRVLVVANGRLEIDITPELGGTISGLREVDVNHLASPFPKVATLGWMSPWYGGVMPIVTSREEHQIPGKIGRERLSAAPVEVTDTRGICWRGVRQRAKLEHEELRGVTLELDALTLGGSPVVKLVIRLVNAAGASRPLNQAGWLIFAQPDGERNQTGWTADHQVKHSDLMIWLRAGHWAALQNPHTGRSLALVAAKPRVTLADFGRDGVHFQLLDRALIPADGTLEITGYLALAGDLDEARRYVALKDLT